MPVSANPKPDHGALVTAARLAAKPTSDFDVVAIVAAFNEGDVVFHVLRDLIENGIQVYFIDNASTDNTREEVSRLLGKGVIKLERFPEDAGYSKRSEKEYVWRDLLRRKVEVAQELKASWYIHADADEFRESPWVGMSLSEAIRVVDNLGYNAINFELLNFRPTDDAFVPGSDVRDHLRYYDGAESFDLMQIKAWKNTGQTVDLASSGGHQAEFAGRRLFPLPFVHRHYPIRGETHGRQKVMRDRLPRFAAEERASGWHVQYDRYAKGETSFLKSPADLEPYDPASVRLRLMSRTLQDLLLASTLSQAPVGQAPIQNRDVHAWAQRLAGCEPAEFVDFLSKADRLLAALVEKGSVGFSQLEGQLDTATSARLGLLLQPHLAHCRCRGDLATVQALAPLADQLVQRALPKPSVAVSAAAPAVSISIVIPVFNHLDLTRQCLEAIRQTTSEVSYEVIAVDNGSQDGTVAFLREREHAGELRAVLNSANLGFAKACNQGAAVANGDFVLFLNNDTLPRSGWLKALELLLRSDPKIGVAGSKLLYEDGSIQHAGIVVGMREGDPAPYHVYLCQPADAPFVNRIREFQMVTGACLAIRRSLFMSVGGFDEGYINGHEDLDLCLKARQAGFKVVYCPQSVVTHLESRTKRLIGLDNFHYQKGVDNEEARGRKRFLDRWRTSLEIDESRIYASDGVQVRGLPTSEPEPSASPASSSGVRKPLHILFTMYGWAEEGGGTILPRQIAKALTRRGHRVSVIYTAAQTRPGCPPYHVEHSTEEGVSLYAVFNRPALFYDLDHPEREVEDPNMRGLVGRLVRELKPDLVHYHSLLNFSLGTVAEVHQAQVPAVYTSHNYWPLCPRMYLFDERLQLCGGPSVDGQRCAQCVHQLSQATGYAQRLAASGQTFSHAIGRHLAVSHRVKELFAANGHDARNIVVLQQQPETVDHLWQQVGQKRPCAQAPGEPLRIGFIGSLLAQKGVHVLVAAAQGLPDTACEVHIFGDGPATYVNHLRALDVRHRVQFHGAYRLEELPDVLQRLDVVVVPSIWEDCAPLVVAEAMAARCPVVGSRIGGIPDFIRDETDGLLAAPRDPQALARTLARFLQEPGLLERLRAGIRPPKGFNAYLDELLVHYADAVKIETGNAPLNLTKEKTQEADSLPKPATSGGETVETPPGAPTSPGSQLFAGLADSRRPTAASLTPISAGANAPSESTDRTASVAVCWQGSQFVHHSLALINRELCLELIARRHEVSIVPYERDQFDPSVDPRFAELTKRIGGAVDRSAQVHVRHQWPPDFTRPMEGKLVLIQPWEYGAAPKAWVAAFNQHVDEIWVPSHYIRKGYIESGVRPDRVVVVPNGVDPDRFTPGVTPLALATQKRFKFLFVGGTIHRKGPDLLLQAYLDAFSAKDDVVLVIKDFGGKSCYQGQTLGSRIRAAQDDPNAPEILYLEDDLPPDAMPGLYAACDCLVHPYRGEGFGLPVLEAMACGLPAVVTEGGATDEFTTPDCAYRVPATRREIGSNLGDVALAKTGWLLEPDIEALKRQMRRAYEAPDEAKAKGVAASAIARRDWTWAKAADIAEQRLIELAKTVRLRLPTSEKAPVSVVPLALRRDPPPPTATVGRLKPAYEAFARHQYADAWKLALDTLQSRPYHPEAFVLLGEAAMAIGDYPRATECSRRALELAPSFDLARQLAGQLSQAKAGSSKPKANGAIKRPPRASAAGWPPLPSQRTAKDPPRLSVCLIVKNEEDFIEQCLRSIRPIASQIVVVDTGSTDRTVELARRHGAEIHTFAWNDSFSDARNAALAHATGDWVLMLDADEELPPSEHSKLLREISDSTVIGYRLPITNRGQEDEGVYYVPRLYRNAPGLFYISRVHEQVFPSVVVRAQQWGLRVEMGTAILVHHGYSKELTASRNKIERNLRLLRQALQELPDDANLIMNLGLELSRSGQVEEGAERYREAFELMGRQGVRDAVPELREALATQYVANLLKLNRHADMVELMQTPLVQATGPTACLHYMFGLALAKLERFEEAAEQFRHCLAKRGQPALTAIFKEVRSAAPRHFLANCLATVRRNAEARIAYQEALQEDPNCRSARFDFARFLSLQGESVPALQNLNQLVGERVDDPAVWQLGAAIALATPDLRDFALDWTGEAVKFLPGDKTIQLQRAEALLLGQRSSEALEIYRQNRNDENPNYLAALTLCEILGGRCGPTVSPRIESAVSQTFIKWYRRLVTCGAKDVIHELNARVELIKVTLPSAARTLSDVLREAALDRA